MTTRTPRVSVCVPTYNGAAFLEAALDSIGRQSCDDFEVLVLDDGSADESLEIARAFASRDARFRVEANATNLGLVGNWNRCIDLAQGEWIKLAFQDDLLDEHCLKKMLAAADAVDAGFVACSRHLWFAPETDASLRRFHAAHDRILASLYRGGRTLTAAEYCLARLAHLSYNIVGEPTATLVRRTLFSRWGPFDPSLVQICDAEMWDRLGTNVGLAYVDEPLVTFRVHDQSASNRNRQRQFRSGPLEQIVYLHALCQAPAYDNLRRVASETGQGKRLKQRLSAQINMAQDQLRWAEGLGRDGVGMKAEFDTIVGRLPALRPSRLNHLVWRFRRKLHLPLSGYVTD